MHCRARYLFIAVVSVLGIGQMIAACGQKGDLYLPEPEPATRQQATSGAGKDPPPPVGVGQAPREEEATAVAAGTGQVRQE